MKISLKSSSPQKQNKTCLMLGVYEGGHLTPAASEVNKASNGFITRLFKQGMIKGKVGENLPLFQVANSAFEHILLVGCGKPNTLTPTSFRKMMVNAIKTLSNTETEIVTCYLSEV